MITLLNDMDGHFLQRKGRKPDIGAACRDTGKFAAYHRAGEEFGPSIGRPHTAPLGKGLFEIRAKGPEGISRSLFCTIKGPEIVILHTFIKKTQKMPKKPMALARKRMKELTEND